MVRRFVAVAIIACLVLPQRDVSGQTSVVVTRSPTDTLGYSYRLFLPNSAPRGLLVLLGNWGNHFSEFDWQRVTIQRLVADSGIATMQISNTPWRNNYFGDAAVAAVDSLIARVVRERQ